MKNIKKIMTCFIFSFLLIINHISSGESFEVINNTSTPYIPAVIKGEGGVTFTQPFKIIESNPAEKSVD